MLLDDVIAEARRSGGLSVLNQALVLRADLGYRTGDWQPALADAAESVALARDAGQRIHSAYALAMLAILEAARGDEREARETPTPRASSAAGTGCGWSTSARRSRSVRSSSRRAARKRRWSTSSRSPTTSPARAAESRRWCCGRPT